MVLEHQVEQEEVVLVVLEHQVGQAGLQMPVQGNLQVEVQGPLLPFSGKLDRSREASFLLYLRLE